MFLEIVYRCNFSVVGLGVGLLRWIFGDAGNTRRDGGQRRLIQRLMSSVMSIDFLTPKLQVHLSTLGIFKLYGFGDVVFDRLKPAKSVGGSPVYQIVSRHDILAYTC